MSASVSASARQTFDILVVGAGPSGLCFAQALAGSGLSVAVVERQPRAALAAPADDGREIALTHRSQRILQSLGIWDRFAPEEVAPLRDALVLDGASPEGLRFLHRDSGRPQLGWLVSNHAIRRAAFDAFDADGAAQLRDGVRVTGLRRRDAGIDVALDTGETLRASLVVAADSRFSDTRRAMGIAASMRDFGKTMLVCRMRHAEPHARTAWEWFDYGQTLALLPLHDPHVSSIVLTLPHAEAQALQALDADALSADITRRFLGRLGAMTFIGPCCAYPLVGVYPERFVAPRFATIGDAAVGMHPVTAHGFNFGLRGADALAALVRAAHAAGRPFHEDALLRRYALGHRLATRPLYLATQTVAGLYTDDSAPAKFVRRALLRIAQKTPPFQRAVMAGLTGDGRAPALVRTFARAAARLGEARPRQGFSPRPDAGAPRPRG